MLANISVGDISDEVIPETVEKREVQRLMAQGELLELSDSKKVLVKRLAVEPAHRDDRNPGRFERLLGEEPVRTYVPLLPRPWVMDCALKEDVHLGEKVTLTLLQRYYWWIGMADSVKWWIRRCYTCQARKSARGTVRWPLVSLPLPSRPGQMVPFDLLGPLPETKNGNVYVFLIIVDLFSRHAEGYICDDQRREDCQGMCLTDSR